MRCDEVMEYMQRNLDGDLSADELSQMNEHLHACTECQSLYAGLKQLSSDLENLPDVDPPVSIVDQILPQLVMTNSGAVGMIRNVQPRTKKAVDWKKWSTIAGGLAAVAFVWVLSERTFAPEMKNSNVQMQSAADEQSTIEKNPELSSGESLDEKSIADKEAAPLKDDRSIALKESAVPNQESKATVDEEVALKPKSGENFEQKLQPLQESSKNKMEIKSEVNTSESKVAIANDPQKPSSPEKSQDEEVSSLAAVGEPSDSTPPPMGLVPEEEMAMNRALVAPAPEMKEQEEMEQRFVSPNGQWTAHLQANSIVVFDLNGLEVFRSHSWQEGMDVKINWIDDYHLEYHLVSTKNQTLEPTESEIWSINLEERQEHKQ